MPIANAVLFQWASLTRREFRAMDDARERCEEFRARYRGAPAVASLRLGQRLADEDLGVNGYTTVGQADRLAAALEVGVGDRVLDLGSGRGWPGTRVAAVTGARVVLTDLPMEPLLEAHRYAAARDVAGRVTTVRAHAAALPFREGVFRGVAHADVLCWIEAKLSVLRACRDLLEPGGRIAGFSIHATSDDPRAAELGPSRVHADASLADLHRAAGFADVVETDVTPAFEASCVRFLQAGAELAEDAEREGWREALEAELERKRRRLQGVREGLVRRSFVVGRASADVDGARLRGTDAPHRHDPVWWCVWR